jgi:Protein of unknown function (DUF3263)
MTSVLPRRGAQSDDIEDVNREIVEEDVLDDSLEDFDDATPVVVEPEVPSLSDGQRAMLVFERKWWRHAGSKEQAIREQFKVSATRYYQLLNQLLDSPLALEFDPLVVGRLRRLRMTRSQARTAH